MPINKKLTAMPSTRPSTTSPNNIRTMSKGWAGMTAPDRAKCGHTPSEKTMVTAALTGMGMLLVEKTGSMNMTMLTRIMVSNRLSAAAGL